MAEEDTSPVPPPAEEPVIPPPEAPPAPAEPEAVQGGPMEQASAPVDGHVVEAPLEPQTAQIPLNEPLPVKPEPLPSQPEPIAPAPERPQAASTSVASAPISTGNSRDMFVKARAVVQERKQKKLDKIMEALNATDPTTLKLRRAGEITNDEVEKLLHVSDATATRYLSALEKDGKIKQVGKTGVGVVYTKV